MRVAILQPGYLPWLGYFEQMAAVDEFWSLDDVPYTKQDWRNRNRIRTRTAQGWSWLTVPVRRGAESRPICQVEVAGGDWGAAHLRQLDQHYRRAPFYEEHRPFLAELLTTSWRGLAELDLHAAAYLARALGVSTPVRRTSQLQLPAGLDRNDRLLAICAAAGATALYDGASAAAFLDRERFRAAGVSVAFQSYRHPVYSQVYSPFIPYLSALDCLLCAGGRAGDLMREGGHRERVNGEEEAR